jgi:hypothetical protein
MENNCSLNLSLIPKELELILHIMRNENLNNKDELIEAFNGINWEYFLELAMHHRLYPILYGKLKKTDDNLIPNFVVQELSHSYKMNTFQMLKLSGEMEQLCKTFNENQIQILVLKGPVLAEDLYGDISLRTCGDLDVLVPISQLDNVNKILINQGYQKDDYIQTVLNDWRWRHHHVTYFHPEKRVKIEIHWRLNPGPGKEPSFWELWERKRVSSLTSYPVYYLGKEDLFVFLVSHGARHGWSRLRWLVDISQLIKQKMDWLTLVSLLKKYQYYHVGGQAIVLASQLLATPIMKEMKPLIKGNHSIRLAQGAIFYLEKTVNLHNEPLPADIASYHKHHLFFLMSNKQKFLFIMSFLYPYPEDAKTLPLPEHLHFLYFLLRPFLWAWRKTKHHAIS